MEEYLKNAISLEEIERSIQKKYKVETFSKFLKALDKYDLIQEGDKIAVGMSGGKDSLLLAKMLQIFQTNIFEIVHEISKDSPCYLCARMRRGNLYAKAKELGCNKLALGHHFNDVIETIMLNIMWAGAYRTMMPKLKSQNFEGLELIRPLYLIEERDIIRWLNNTGIVPMDEACPIMEKKNDSQRQNIKMIIENLKKENPNVEKSIFKSSENVFAGAVLEYDLNGIRHSFLDEYDDYGG